MAGRRRNNQIQNERLFNRRIDLAWLESDSDEDDLEEIHDLEKEDFVQLIFRQRIDSSSQQQSRTRTSTEHLDRPEKNNVVERENFCEWFEMLDTREDKDVIQTQNENVFNIDDVIPIKIEKTMGRYSPDIEESTSVISNYEDEEPNSSASSAPSEVSTQQESDEGLINLAVRGTDQSIFENKGSLSAASSPSRRFANQGMVRLDEIESLEDFSQLSAKQCKDLLAVNRVNHHGILEKVELVRIAQRLWTQEQKALKEKDLMDDHDLCKICWDAPIDCVMLECGHMGTCTSCGKQLSECPICRQYVVRVVRTFKA